MQSPIAKDRKLILNLSSFSKVKPEYQKLLLNDLREKNDISEGLDFLNEMSATICKLADEKFG